MISSISFFMAILWETVKITYYYYSATQLNSSISCMKHFMRFNYVCTENIYQQQDVIKNQA
jgi:hypothetical protein